MQNVCPIMTSLLHSKWRIYKGNMQVFWILAYISMQYGQEIVEVVPWFPKTGRSYKND